MGKWIIFLAAFAAKILPSELKRGVYRLGIFTTLIRKSLNRQLPSGISEQVIAGGPLRGCKFYLDMQSEKDYWLGTYEVALLESVGKLIQPGWVVYDVGANVGYLTVLFAKLTGKNGKVYAFEPLPANIERLVKNVEANDVKEQVIVCPYAIGDRRDEVVFYLGNSDDTGKVETIVTANEKETKENKDKLIVEMITLDEFAEQNTDHYPQLIKMDIEGAEVLAIKNMQRILQTIKPFMIIEIHSKDAGQVVWNELTKYNYIVKKLDNPKEKLLDSTSITKRDYLLGLPS